MSEIIYLSKKPQGKTNPQMSRGCGRIQKLRSVYFCVCLEFCINKTVSCTKPQLLFQWQESWAAGCPDTIYYVMNNDLWARSTTWMSGKVLQFCTPHSWHLEIHLYNLIFTMSFFSDNKISIKSLWGKSYIKAIIN